MSWAFSRASEQFWGGAGAHPGSLSPILMLFLYPAISRVVSWGGAVVEESLLGPSLCGESQWAGLAAGVWWALECEQEGALARVREHL